MDTRISGGYLRSLLLVSCMAPSMCMALTPTLKVTVETPQRPVIVGETNLPDGTELLLTISRRENKYEAQTTVKVDHGHFRSEQFSQKGSDFNPGKYSLEFVMPVAQVQSDAVRAIIGQRGEKLSGPLVSRGVIGPVVRYTTTFQSGGAPSAKADSAARAREKKDRAEWVVKSCKDMMALAEPHLSPMERQRDIDKCIVKMNSK